MHILIRNANGIVREGALLAAGSDRVRVILREASSDTVELHRTEEGWRFDDGTTAEFEALLAPDGAAAFYAGIYPLTQSAARRALA